MKFHKLKIILTALIAFSMTIGAWNAYQASADPESLVDYKVIQKKKPRPDGTGNKGY